MKEWTYDLLFRTKFHRIGALCCARNTKFNQFWNSVAPLPSLPTHGRGWMWYSTVSLWCAILYAKFHVDGAPCECFANIDLNMMGEKSKFDCIFKFNIRHTRWRSPAAHRQSWTRAAQLETLSKWFLSSNALMAILLAQLYRSKTWQTSKNIDSPLRRRAKSEPHRAVLFCTCVTFWHPIYSFADILVLNIWGKMYSTPRLAP